MARLEAENFQKELESEKLRQELQLEAIKKKRKVFSRELDRKLRKYIPKITEINLIAQEMKREVMLSLELEYLHDIINQGKPLISVIVDNYEEKIEYSWSVAKFRNRYLFIKELFDKFLLECTKNLCNYFIDTWKPAKRHLLPRKMILFGTQLSQFVWAQPI